MGILFTVSGFSSLFSQEYSLFSSAYSTERLVYKIPASTATDLSYKSRAFFEKAVPIDTMPIYDDVEAYLEQQAYGHYVFVTVYRNELFFNYYQHSPFRVKHLEDGDILRFRVFDDQNQELRNLAAVSHKQIAFYNYEEDCYRFKKPLKVSRFSIINALDTFYYTRSGSAEASKITHKENRKTKGVVLLNKPKYRLGDTLKMAAYVKRKNGEPFSKDLHAFLSNSSYRHYSSQRVAMLGTLSPEKPGLYLFETVISDTLQIDRTYYLHVREKTEGFKGFDFYGSFRLEDYRLDESRLDVNVKQHIIGIEDSIVLDITSKNANGLGLRGASARIKVFPQAIENLDDSNHYLPLVWYNEKVALDPSGSTEVLIDKEMLSKGYMNLRVEVTITNASNETETFVRGVYKKESTTLPRQDSLYRFIDKTSHFELKALVKAFKGRKCEAIWTSKLGDTLLAEATNTSNKFNWLSNASKLRLNFEDPLFHKGVSHEQIVISLSDYKSLVFLNTDRNDTICSFFLVNNRGLRVNYQLYKASKLIESGVCNESRTWRQTGKDKHGYTLRIAYEWAGSMFNDYKLSTLNTLKLDVRVDATEKSFPGSTEEIKVSVKDHKGQNVPYADVIAYGINDNFQAYVPDNFSYTSKYKKVHFKSSSLSESDTRFHERKLDKKEVQKLSLNSQRYYQWMYPDSGYKVHPHLASKYTSFRIHALRNGTGLTARVIYVDDVPVFINGVSSQQNILCDTDTHTLRIRLRNSEVVLKNVVLTKGVSNEIVFDVRLPHANMEVIKMPLKLKRAERKLLSKYVLRVRSSESIWISSKHGYWSVGRHRYGLIGPLTKGESIQVHTEEELPISMKFEEFVAGELVFFEDVKIKRSTLFLNYQKVNSGKPIHFFNSYAPRPIRKSNYTVSPQSYKGNVYEVNGGAFVLALPEGKQWTWELKHLGDSSTHNSSYASQPPSLGFDTTIKPGEYRIKATCDDEIRVYQFIVKEGFLLNINEANELDFLKRKKELKAPKSTISGQAYDITKGGNAINSFNIKGNGHHERVRETLQRNGEYGFDVEVPVPNTYWLSDLRDDPLMAFEFNNFGFAEIKLVMRPFSYYQRDTMRYNGRRTKRRQIPMVLDSRFMGDYSYHGVTDSTAIFNDLNPYRGNAFDWDYGDNKPLARVKASKAMYSWMYKDDQEIYDKVGAYSVAVPFLNISPDAIRTNFSDEAFWQPVLSTNAQGEVSFKCTLPDDITKWKTYYYVFGPGRTTGVAKADINSFLPVSANLRTPRFFVEGDVVDFSLQALNYTGDTLNLVEQLIFQNELVMENQVELDGEKTTLQRVEIPSNIEEVKASYLIASENGFKDGEERSTSVYRQGIVEQLGHFRQVDHAGSFSLDFDPNLGDITIYTAPNPLPGLLKSLDGLKKYPHSCNEQLASKLTALLIDESVGDAMNDSKGHSFEIKRIIRKLEKNQNEFGAWTWFGTNGTTSDWVTLHVVKALAKAREIGYSVDLGKVQMDLFIKHQTNSAAKLRWMHAARKDVAPETLKGQLNQLNYNGLSTYSKVLYLDLLHSVSGQDVSVQLNALLQRTATGMLYCGDDKAIFYENNLVSTCLAFDLFKALGDENKLPKLAAYLLYSQRNGEWSNTLQKALILERLIPYYTKDEEDLKVPASISLETVQGSRTIRHKITVPAQKTLSFTKTGSTPLFFTAYQSSFNTNPVLKNELADIELSYFVKDREQQQLKAGTPVTMICSLQVKEKMEYCTLSLPIAAGCDYGDKVQGAYSHQLREVHREYFRDRVVIYFENIAPGAYAIEVALEPRYSGSYVQNPSQLELMYFPTLNANNTLKRVEIAR